MLKPFTRITALATLLPVFAGCSLAMRQVPSSYRPEQGEPSCSGAALPVVDTVAATTFVVAGASILADKPEEQDPTCQVPGCADLAISAGFSAAAETARVMAGVTALAIAAIYTVSAVHGYKNAGQCRDAWSARGDWLRSNPRDEVFVPQLPASPPGWQCQVHEQCGPGNGCDPTTHRCVELP